MTMIGKRRARTKKSPRQGASHGHGVYKGLLAILLMVVLMMPRPLWAAEAAVILIMSDSNLTMGTSGTLSVTFRNVSSVESLSIEGIDAFDIVDSRQSRATSIHNGDRTEETTVTYTVMPKKEGTVTLRARAKTGDGEELSNAVTVTIAPRNTDLGEGAEEVFLKTTVGDKQVYMGEKVVVTYDLYSRYQLDSYGFTTTPIFEGFLMEDRTPQNRDPGILDIGGTTYANYKGAQVVLTPTKAGAYTLPAYDFVANVSSGDFFGTSRPVYLTTEPFDLEVLPLPTEGRPDDFAGLVGQWTLESSYDKGEVAYGEPVTLKVTLRGEGSLEALTSLGLEERLPGFSVYETSGEVRQEVRGRAYYSEKDLEVILVPKEVGDLAIPDMDLAYFEPESASYKQLTIPGKTLKVTGSKPESPAISSGEATGRSSIIRQVQYGQAEEGYIIWRFKASTLRQIVIGIMTVVAMVAVFWVYWKVFRRSGQRPTPRKAIGRASDYTELYDVLCQWVAHQYGKDPRSYEDEVIEGLIGHERLALVKAAKAGDEPFKSIKKACLKAFG